MIKLTAKMSEALEYVDAYGNAGAVHHRTLAALLRHRLVDDESHGVRGGVVWNLRVTLAGAEAFSVANRKHLNGRFTVQATDVPPVPEYLTATTVHMGQRVYLYDGQQDRQVAGNVVAIAGQSLDVIVVQAWVWADGRARKATFYPTRVRSGDQLRAAVETPPASPFPVGLRVAAHLSPERVYLVDSVEVGPHDGVTRVYLVHSDGERLAFRPSVLAKMFAPALEPFPNAEHLIGERVTLTSADPRQRMGTISGVVARVRPAPLGSAHALAELESGYLVDLPASLVEATAPRR